MKDTQVVADIFTNGRHDWIGSAKDSYNVSYTNRSSVGNRYVNWEGLWAYKSVSDETLEGTVVSTEHAHDLIREYDWRSVFAFIEYGLFVGPSTKEALRDCAKLIKEAQFPEEGGPKKRVWNGMTWVLVTARTEAEWNLVDSVKKRMLEGFTADKNEKRLLSDDWVYKSHSHRGWSRSC